MGWRNTLRIGSELPVEEERPVFILAGTELPMPSLVVTGEPYAELEKKLLLPPGTVSISYGKFWLLWVGAELGERALKEIVDMYDGCYQLQADGKWLLLGAS